MNNNRNNRRRGRGNRNQGGNGAQLNRIDSRARGNAPQMLDKYKKLAQDAQHNGDRVQMEYYLQFADHYFRVIADNKARADEQRGGRRGDDREQVEDYGEDDFDFDRGRRADRGPRVQDSEGEPYANGNIAEGEPGQEGEPFLTTDRDTPQTDAGDDGRDDRAPRQRRQRKPRESGRDGERQERPERPERAERAERPERKRAERAEPKPARGRKPRNADQGDGPAGIDSSILPPSIRGDDAGGAHAGDNDGALETVE